MRTSAPLKHQNFSNIASNVLVHSNDFIWICFVSKMDFAIFLLRNSSQTNRCRCSREPASERVQKGAHLKQWGRMDRRRKELPSKRREKNSCGHRQFRDREPGGVPLHAADPGRTRLSVASHSSGITIWIYIDIWWCPWHSIGQFFLDLLRLIFEK